MLTAADEQPVTAAMRQEVFARKAAAQTVVAADRAIAARIADRTPYDHRDILARDLLQQDITRALAEHDEAVRAARLIQVNEAVDCVEPRWRQQQIKIADRQGLRNTRE